MIRVYILLLLFVYIRLIGGNRLDCFSFNLECILFFITKCYSAQQSSENASNTGRKLGNQVIRKGYMSISNLGIMKGGSRDYWFVLSSETLSWYKDDEVFPVWSISFVVLNLNISFLLDGRRKIRSTCWIWMDWSCVISNKDSCLVGMPLAFLTKTVATCTRFRKSLCACSLLRILYLCILSLTFQDYKQLEVSCEPQDDVDSWKASFLRAGVYPEKLSDTTNGEESADRENSASMDPQLERQVHKKQKVLKHLLQS